MNSSDILGKGTPPSRPVPAEWRPYERRLRALANRLAGDQAALREDVQASLEPHSESQGDTATDQFDHDLALAELQAESNLLGEITEALKRIDRGTYGTCERTGRPIPAERLQAVPWTRFTVEAEAEVEREGSLPHARLGELGTVRQGSRELAGTEPEAPADPADEVPDSKPTGPGHP